MREEPKCERKALAERYYRFLSGHVAIGSCLCKRYARLRKASASGSAVASGNPGTIW